MSQVGAAGQMYAMGLTYGPGPSNHYDGKTWTGTHLIWLRAQPLDAPGFGLGWCVRDIRVHWRGRSIWKVDPCPVPGLLTVSWPP